MDMDNPRHLIFFCGLQRSQELGTDRNTVIVLIDHVRDIDSPEIPLDQGSDHDRSDHDRNASQENQKGQVDAVVIARFGFIHDAVLTIQCPTPLKKWGI
jgi:hypothetical protein